LSEGGAWRPVVLTVSLACLALIPIVAFCVPEHPGDVGTGRHGEIGGDAPAAPIKQAATVSRAIGALVGASRQPIFWLLFATFFVCGLTTNGLVGTHLIVFFGDHGIIPV